MSGECLGILTLKNGSCIKFYRDEDKSIRVCRDDQCLIMPHGSGVLTVRLLSLLEEVSGVSLEEEKEETWPT